MNRILVALLIVALVIGGWMLYQRHNANSTFYNGEVVSRDASADKSKTETPDADGKPVTDDQGQASGAATNQPPDQMKAPIATETSTGVPAPASVPATDSIAPNPPDRLAFGGTGRYQWYRQGNLTWRVDTGNGATCIAFATMEEWRKPIVYTHGCGNA